MSAIRQRSRKRKRDTTKNPAGGFQELPRSEALQPLQPKTAPISSRQMENDLLTEEMSGERLRLRGKRKRHIQPSVGQNDPSVSTAYGPTKSSSSAVGPNLFDNMTSTGGKTRHTTRRNEPATVPQQSHVTLAPENPSVDTTPVDRFRLRGTRQCHVQPGEPSQQKSEISPPNVESCNHNLSDGVISAEVKTRRTKRRKEPASNQQVPTPDPIPNMDGNSPLDSSSDNHSCDISCAENNHSLSYYRNQTVCQIEPLTNYVSSVVATKQIFQLSTGSHFAMKDCDHYGNLSKGYVIIQNITKSCRDGVVQIPVCSCTSSSIQSSRIRDTIIPANSCLQSVLRWKNGEFEKSCMHIRAFNSLDSSLTSSNAYENDNESHDDDSDNTDEANDLIDQLSLAPFLAAVYKSSEGKYSIIEKAKSTAKRRYKCITCTSNNYHCTHVEAYEHWLLDQGLADDAMDPSLFADDSQATVDDISCVTTQKYAYPHTQEMCDTYTSIENRIIDFPNNCVPSQTNELCTHGFSYDNRDPVEQGWVEQSEATIYTMTRNVTTTVYYRPTCNKRCECKYFYQGSNDLLLNIDNKSLVYMPYLVQYMHDSVEGTMPMQAHIRSIKRTAMNLAGNDKNVMPYKLFRRAFYSGSRLLDIDYEKLFYCKKCDNTGDGPETIIIDGKMMGMRKDMMPDLNKWKNYTEGLPRVPEVPICDRLYLHNVKARKAILKYVGMQKAKLCEPPDLSDIEFANLVNDITLCQPTLGTLIESFGKNCPKGARLFLGQLGLGSPSCAILPIAAKLETQENILKVARDNLNLRIPSQQEMYDDIKTNAPLILDFLTTCVEKSIDIDNFAQEFISNIRKPFENRTIPTYSDITDEQNTLECFPAYPPVRGRANYASDRARGRKESTCRKETVQHRSLTPGLFIASCVHKVALGFVFMKDFESPRTAFNMILSRFKKAPKLVIYDNSCQLATYSLKREPVFFKETQFAIDRWHFSKNHVGCTLAFDLRQYSKFSGLNSSLREQENRFLSRISSQIIYMKLTNAMWLVKLFHALRNITNT